LNFEAVNDYLRFDLRFDSNGNFRFAGLYLKDADLRKDVPFGGRGLDDE